MSLVSRYFGHVPNDNDGLCGVEPASKYIWATHSRTNKTAISSREAEENRGRKIRK